MLLICHNIAVWFEWMDSDSNLAMASAEMARSLLDFAQVCNYTNFKSFLFDLSAQQECVRRICFHFSLLFTSQSSLKELNIVFLLQRIRNNDKKVFHNITRSLSAQTVHGFYGVQC